MNGSRECSRKEAAVIDKGGKMHTPPSPSSPHLEAIVEGAEDVLSPSERRDLILPDAVAVLVHGALSRRDQEREGMVWVGGIIRFSGEVLFFYFFLFLPVWHLKFEQEIDRSVFFK